MARQLAVWLFLSWKRALKRPFFLLLLFLLPLGAGVFRQAEELDSGTIAIALYTDGDAWNQRVAEELMAEEGSFEFYLCGTAGELEADVAAGRAECGYLFPADFRARLESGSYKRAVRVVVSPSTAAAELASETVFAGLFRVLGKELLEQYVTEGEAFAAVSEENLWKQIKPLYEKALSNGSTFAFEYETLEGGKITESRMKASFPVRGTGAVFVFVMGLAAAVTAAEDEKRGLYAAMPCGRKRLFQLVSVASLVFLSCISVYFSLAVAGEGRGIFTEAAVLLCYGGAAAVCSSLLLCLLKQPLVLSGLIPFFILGSLVSCPVFVDLSVFVPVLSVVRRFFLPWYYLRL